MFSIISTEYLQNTFYWGNSLFSYLQAMGIFLVVILVTFMLKLFILARFRNLAKKSDTKADDLLIKAISSIGLPFYLILGFNIASRRLNLPQEAWSYINGFTIVVLIIYLFARIQEIIIYVIRKFIARKKTDEGESVDTSMANFLAIFANILIWLIAVIIILQSFNINVATLVGGLGITGIAVAFALQNVLSDIFASFTIYLDRPFEIGDFIVVGEDHGTVEHIGIKSTRIRDLGGYLLVYSNKELTESRIANYGDIQRRRVVMKLGLEYSTSSQQLKMVPGIVKNIIKEIEICEFSRVHFTNFGHSSLDYELVYFVNNPDYAVMMDIKQKINLEIKQNFEENGIKFAYPTQTIMVKNN